MLSPRWVSCRGLQGLVNSHVIHIDQAETVSRRVEKFAELMQSVWISKNDYERRARNVCLVSTDPFCFGLTVRP